MKRRFIYTHKVTKRVIEVENIMIDGDEAEIVAKKSLINALNQELKENLEFGEFADRASDFELTKVMYRSVAGKWRTK